MSFIKDDCNSKMPPEKTHVLTVFWIFTFAYRGLEFIIGFIFSKKYIWANM